MRTAAVACRRPSGSGRFTLKMPLSFGTASGPDHATQPFSTDVREVTYVAKKQSRGGSTGEGMNYLSIPLYVPAAQVLVSLTATSLATILIVAVVPQDSSSAPRATIGAAVVVFVCTFKPVPFLQCGDTHNVFDALRPAVWLYWASAVMEQLVYACGGCRNGTWGTTLRVVHHVCTAAAASMGILRAYRPRWEEDFPSIVAVLALLVTGFFPPPPSKSWGPLTVVEGVWDAFERTTRAVLFGLTYCSMAYATEASLRTQQDVRVCAARAAAASVWVLVVHVYAVPLAVFQSLLAVYQRVAHQSALMLPIATEHAPDRFPTNGLPARRSPPPVETSDGLRFNGVSNFGGAPAVAAQPTVDLSASSCFRTPPPLSVSTAAEVPPCSLGSASRSTFSPSPNEPRSGPSPAPAPLFTPAAHSPAPAPSRFSSCCFGAAALQPHSTASSARDHHGGQQSVLARCGLDAMSTRNGCQSVWGAEPKYDRLHATEQRAVASPEAAGGRGSVLPSRERMAEIAANISRSE